jgi:hypothetical protein
MRVWLTVAVGLSVFAAGAAERYGVAPDLKTFPQSNPQEALRLPGGPARRPSVGR